MRRSSTLVWSGLIGALPSSIVFLLLLPSGLAASAGGVHSSVGLNVPASPAAVHPAARWADPIAYDAKDGYVLQFGGAGASKWFSETWTYKAGAWTKLTPATHPSARAGEGLVYDAADGYVLLFGG